MAENNFNLRGYASWAATSAASSAKGVAGKAWTKMRGYSSDDYKKAAISAAPVVAVSLTPSLLSTIGFTNTGIAAKSLAAKFMATYGGYVPVKSICAYCQSIGAAGFSAATKCCAGAASFGIAGVTGLFGKREN